MSTGRESPPIEAYGRVTDPDRFAPLHARASALVDDLAERYDVVRTEPAVLPRRLRDIPQARPAVRLAPASPAAAPLLIVFTTFPSLVVQFGRFVSHAFPACACDACAETAEGEWERLHGMVQSLVNGKFSESVRIPFFFFLDATRSASFIDAGALGTCHGEHGPLSRDEARELVGDGPRSMNWTRWPRR